MEIQVVVTRTDAGATSKLMSNGGESSKNYASWDDALKEAERLKLINTVEATAARALPPGFPLHTATEMDAGNLANDGFTPGKTPPPPGKCERFAYIDYSSRSSIAGSTCSARRAGMAADKRPRHAMVSTAPKTTIGSAAVA
jgi:hypothetical protein